MFYLRVFGFCNYKKISHSSKFSKTHSCWQIFSNYQNLGANLVVKYLTLLILIPAGSFEIPLVFNANLNI